MRQPTVSVHPIHFEDFDGSEFERLVFAYHWRCDQWRTLEWYGQVGSDLGRDIWGVRHNGETVCIKRFFAGESFPDAPDELKKLANYDLAATDDGGLALYARVFDRPAFYTPIHQESDLGDFKQAIMDTIQALGTGIWKARDGTIINRIPSRHELRSPSLRTKLQAVEKALTELRAQYDEMIRSGTLHRCQCNDPQCSVYFFKPPGGEQTLERLRENVLDTFRKAYPGFHHPPRLRGYR